MTQKYQGIVFWTIRIHVFESFPPTLNYFANQPKSCNSPGIPKTTRIMLRAQSQSGLAALGLCVLPNVTHGISSAAIQAGPGWSECWCWRYICAAPCGFALQGDALPFTWAIGNISSGRGKLYSPNSCQTAKNVEDSKD